MPRAKTSVVHGLGLEHEFAIEFGMCSSEEQAAWIAELLDVPADQVRGCRVVLDVGNLFGMDSNPKTSKVSLDDVPRKCDRGYFVVQEGFTAKVFINGTVLDLDVSGMHPKRQDKIASFVRKNRDVLAEIAKHEFVLVMHHRWATGATICPVRRRIKSVSLTRAARWILSEIACDPSEVELEMAMASVNGQTKFLPILMEVKSSRHENRSPEQIVRQVRNAERVALSKVRASLGDAFSEARNRFGEPKVCYADRDDRVVILTGQAGRCVAQMVDEVYLGSYHVWISPSHAWPESVSALLTEVLPKYVDDCRALAFAVQWAEPLLFSMSERGSFRHGRQVSDMGTTNLTRLSVSSARGMSCANLTGRYDYNRNHFLVNMGNEQDFVPTQVNDIRTQGMCNMVRLPLRDDVKLTDGGIIVSVNSGAPVDLDDAVDTLRWRALRPSGFQGLEIRVFDNAPLSTIQKYLSFVFITMMRICQERPDSLYRASKQPSRRAVVNLVWLALRDVVRRGAKSEHWDNRAKLAARLTVTLAKLGVPSVPI